MQCPACGLYHPSRYEQCVSCGSKLNADVKAPFIENESSQEQNFQPNEAVSASNRNPYGLSRGHSDKKKLPTKIGVLIAVGIFLASAGGTWFYLSRAPESDRLLNEGQKQLANGQFAFAQKTLEHAVSLKANDPKLLLTLARAYVGVDQLEKAWSCISQAQQLGSGVMTDPQLSSDLANYYRQRNQYQRAAELLRPLANQHLANKKNELADLDCLWGDEAFRQGDTEQAMKCWEEVKELQAGTRLMECDNRLASIYQKMASDCMEKGESETALNYLTKLNMLSPSPQNYEKTSDLYAKQGKLDLAIDQLRRAIKIGSGSIDLNKKLAGLLAKRGKEIIDEGSIDDGYAYLQQAQSLDNKIKMPLIALHGTRVEASTSGTVSARGQIWNPGPNSLNFLSIRTELFDTKESKLLSSKEQRVIDEFVPPLAAKESKPFELSLNAPGNHSDTVELRVYLDGAFYKSYPVKIAAGTFIDKKAVSVTTQEKVSPDSGPSEKQPQPNSSELSTTPEIKPDTPNELSTPDQSRGGMTPEERTMKDLE